jgi:hypothetical protein
VGWIDGDDLYLDREAALKAANAMVADGAGISISASTLSKRLMEKRLLASTGRDRRRNTLTVLKTLSGARQEVLHLKHSTLYPIDEQVVDDHVKETEQVAK